MKGNSFPGLADFPPRTRDKIRNCDTDRQGHVNNAVFSSFLEAGRVELLYATNKGLAPNGRGFVIAKLLVEFLGEIRWSAEVEVGTRVARIGISSVPLEQGLFQDGTCVARAETMIVQTDDETR